MSHVDLKLLQDRVDSLVSAFQKLEHENSALRSEQDGWKTERLELIAQNKLARDKVQAILSRLKKMETGE